MLVLFFAGFVSFATAQCTTDPQSGNCTVPSYTACVDTCSLYKTQNPCKAAAGCAWNGRCGAIDTNKPTECADAVDSAACGAITGCNWKTTPCSSSAFCFSTDQALQCNQTSNATACTAQGAHCVAGGICFDSDRCMVNQAQGACTSTSGCFWSDIQSVQNNQTSTAGLCSQCFNAPDTTENIYSGFRALIGYKCTDEDSVTTILTAIASSTGCSGGVLPPVDNETAAACVPPPTVSKAPTPAGGAPTDDDDNNTDTNTNTTKVTSSAMAVSVSVWAVAGAFFLA